jgi:hypothetical protein
LTISDTGLDLLADDLATDVCGLKDVGARIAAVAPRLAAAVVKVVGSGAEKTIEVIIDTTDVYDELYNAALDLAAGDVTGFGMQLGRLVASLKATSCDSESCTILEGLLEALALEAADWGPCSKDIDAAWSDIESAIGRFRSAEKDGLANLAYGVEDLSNALVALAHGVDACGVKDLSTLLETTATQLGLNTTAGVIGDVEQLLVNGADVTLDVASLVADAGHSRWGALGADLAALALKLNSSECSFIYRYIPRESCSQFDSLPLTSLTISQVQASSASRTCAASSMASSPARALRCRTSGRAKPPSR